MKKLGMLILLLVMVIQIAQGAEPKEEEIEILEVDGRFRRPPFPGLGCTEQGIMSSTIIAKGDAEIAFFRRIKKGAKLIANERIGHSENLFDPSWYINDSDMGILQQVYKRYKDENKLDKLNKIPIRVKLSSASFGEKICDKILFHGPALVGMQGLNYLIGSNVNGVFTGMLGFIVAGVGSFAMGEYAYPMIDSCNSDVGKLAIWFGRKNHEPQKKGLVFLFLGSVDYIFSMSSHVLLNSYRLVFYIFMQHAGYVEPFHRSSAKGVFYTLEDLFGGPLFTKKQ